MQYVGDHSTYNLDDGYMGSGTLLKEDKQLFDSTVFKKEILEFFNTKEGAFLAQEKYIKKYKTHITQGGYNKNWSGGQWATIVSEETKKKLSITGTGRKFSEEHKKKLSLAQKGRKPSPESMKKMSETRRKLNLSKGENNGMFGNNHSLKSRKMMGKTRKERGTEKGKNNPRFDHTIYKFKNEETGEIFEGFKFDLANKIGSNSSALNAVIKGARSQHKKWVIL
jgi:hypothetical protein